MLQVTAIKLSFLILTIAVSWAFIKEKWRLLPLIFRHPSTLPSVNSFLSQSVKFDSALRNCEDGIIVPGLSLALLSCDPGRDLWNTVMGTFTEDREKISDGEIWAYWYDSAIQQEDQNESQALQQVRFQNFDTKGFHPLGIEYHTPSSKLFTVSHHYDGSRIEVFDLNLLTEVGTHATKDHSSPLVAKHIKTIISDTLPAPNAIAAINDHELYVTNDHLFPRRFYPWLSALETFLGISGGGIVYVNIETNEVRKIAHVPFANGISFLNATRLATSSTSTASVRLFDISAEGLKHSLEETSRIDVPFFPDNLSVDEEGILHIAGHPSMKALEQAVRHRLDCAGTSQPQCHKCIAPTWVSRWSEKDGLKDVYISRSGFGSGCTAIRDPTKRLGMITGLYEKGILVWRD